MAFFQETTPARAPIFNVPAVIVALIAVLAVAHALRVLSSDAFSLEILNDYALNPLAYSDPTASLFAQFVPPFSHLFLHANLTHLTLNCLWLLVFGTVIARRFDTLGFTAFFLLCGLAGAIGVVAIDWGQNIGVIGASGAISGLTAAAIRMMRLRQPYLNAATLPLLPLWSGQVLLFSAVWMVANVLTGMWGIGVTEAGEVIAWQAHLGGYIAGLLLATPFDRFVGLGAKVRRAGA